MDGIIKEEYCGYGKSKDEAIENLIYNIKFNNRKMEVELIPLENIDKYLYIKINNIYHYRIHVNFHDDIFQVKIYLVYK